MRQEEWNYKIYKKAEKNFNRAQKRFERDQRLAQNLSDEDKKKRLNAMFRIWGFGGWLLAAMIVGPLLYSSIVTLSEGGFTALFPFLENIF